MFKPSNRTATLPAKLGLQEEPERRRTLSLHLPRTSLPLAGRKKSSFNLTGSNKDSTAPKTSNPTLLADHLNQRFQLKSGSFLSYACAGDKFGYPVVLVMGLGSHRYLSLVFEDLAKRNGLYIIVIDRPGLGLSTSIDKNDWSPLVFSDILIELIDHLSFRTFSLIGQSCGAIYALATAYKYPKRIYGTVQLIAPWVPLRYTNSFEWIQHIPVSVLTLGNTTNNAIQKNNLLSVTTGFGQVDHTTGSFMSSFFSSVQPPKHDKQDKQKQQQNHDDHDQQQQEEREEEFQCPFNAFYCSNSFVTPKPIAITHPLQFQILQAAYSENTSGYTLDLIVSLEKLAPIGFDYNDVTAPVTCYWGCKDPIVPEASIVWMQQWMHDCRVEKIRDAGHGIMFRTDVMERIMQDVNREWICPDKEKDEDNNMMIDPRW